MLKGNGKWEFDIITFQVCDMPEREKERMNEKERERENKVTKQSEKTPARTTEKT